MREFPTDTFEVISREYVDKLRREGRAESTIEKIEWLLSFALPDLGLLTVKAMRAIEILAVLRRVETRGRHETARRLRSTIGAICRYAVATARAETDSTAALQGALTTPTVKSRAAITDPKAFGALLRAIDSFSGQQTTHAALKLVALLFPRPGELRMATWDEFDLEEAVWTIPAARTKMRRAHRVLLPRQAVEILQDLKAITGRGTLAFPCVRTARRPISEGTMNAALRRLGYSQEEATPHGFRPSLAQTARM